MTDATTTTTNPTTTEADAGNGGAATAMTLAEVVNAWYADNERHPQPRYGSDEDLLHRALTVFLEHLSNPLCYAAAQQMCVRDRAKDRADVFVRALDQMARTVDEQQALILQLSEYSPAMPCAGDGGMIATGARSAVDVVTPLADVERMRVALVELRAEADELRKAPGKRSAAGVQALAERLEMLVATGLGPTGIGGGQA